MMNNRFGGPSMNIPKPPTINIASSIATRNQQNLNSSITRMHQNHQSAIANYHTNQMNRFRQQHLQQFHKQHMEQFQRDNQRRTNEMFDRMRQREHEQLQRQLSLSRLSSQNPNGVNINIDFLKPQQQQQQQYFNPYDVQQQQQNDSGQGDSNSFIECDEEDNEGWYFYDDDDDNARNNIVYQAFVRPFESGVPFTINLRSPIERNSNGYMFIQDESSYYLSKILFILAILFFWFPCLSVLFIYLMYRSRRKVTVFDEGRRLVMSGMQKWVFGSIEETNASIPFDDISDFELFQGQYSGVDLVIRLTRNDERVLVCCDSPDIQQRRLDYLQYHLKHWKSHPINHMGP